LLIPFHPFNQHHHIIKYNPAAFHLHSSPSPFFILHPLILSSDYIFLKVFLFSVVRMIVREWGDYSSSFSCEIQQKFLQ
jgi:hypothetical protein